MKCLWPPMKHSDRRHYPTVSIPSAFVSVTRSPNTETEVIMTTRSTKRFPIKERFHDQPPASVCSPSVIHDQHIEPLPSGELLFVDQKLPFQFLSVLSRRKRHKTLERTGHQVRAGNTAQQPLRTVPDIQRIKNIQQILLQRVALVYKGKPDQHIAVHDLSFIIHLAAPSCGRHRTDGQRRFIVARLLLHLPDIYDPILQPFVSSVIKIEVQSPCPEKRAHPGLLPCRLRRQERRPVIQQPVGTYLKRFRNLI